MVFCEQARLQASGQDQGRHGDLHAASSLLLLAERAYEKQRQLSSRAHFSNEQ